MADQFTVVTKTREHVLTASPDGDAGARVAGLFEALGFELKPEGLCRGPLCYPVPASMKLVTGDGVSLEQFGLLTGSPVAIDRNERVAAIGEPAQVRAASLEDGMAPDFTLPDLSGRLHSLSDFRGRKVLLAAWASW